MKSTGVLWTSCVAGLVLAASWCRGAETSSPPAVPAPATAETGGVLSDADLKNMVVMWSDPATSNRYSFSASFSFDRRKSAAWKSGDPIPIRITAQFLRTGRDGNGRMTAAKVPGDACFYVSDAEGRVVVQGKENLLKLSPT
jgi:hypothetical protein